MENNNIETLKITKTGDNYQIEGNSSLEGVLKMLCASIESIEQNFDFATHETLAFITFNLLTSKNTEE